MPLPLESRRAFACNFVYLALALAVGVGTASGAMAKVKYDFNCRFDGTYAEHTNAPIDPASERVEVQAREKIQFNRHWRAVGTLQGWYEGLYSEDYTYPEPLRNADFYEVRAQDTYLEYNSTHWIVKAGNQIDVWGETFGNFYADVVNPKDLREGVPLDQASLHLATPALSIRYIRRRFSIEGLYIAQPVFNILPLPGSDFSPPLGKMTGFSQVQINRELTKPFFSNGGEYGARVSQTIGGADFSLFILNYYDRDPYYTVAPNSTPYTLLSLDEQHWQMITEGLSFATDVHGYLVRAEGVYNAGRVFPTLEGASLSRVQTSEIAYAASVDFPSWGRMNSTLQYSSSNLTAPAAYLSREQKQSYLGLKLNFTMFESSSLETSLYYSLADQGVRAEAEFMTPISSTTEVRFGAEEFTGGADSEYGRLPRASRVYVLFRVQFSS